MRKCIKLLLPLFLFLFSFNQNIKAESCTYNFGFKKIANSGKNSFQLVTDQNWRNSLLVCTFTISKETYYDVSISCRLTKNNEGVSLLSGDAENRNLYPDDTRESDRTCQPYYYESEKDWAWHNYGENNSVYFSYLLPEHTSPGHVNLGEIYNLDLLVDGKKYQILIDTSYINELLVYDNESMFENGQCRSLYEAIYSEDDSEDNECFHKHDMFTANNKNELLEVINIIQGEGEEYKNLHSGIYQSLYYMLEDKSEYMSLGEYLLDYRKECTTYDYVYHYASSFDEIQIYRFALYNQEAIDLEDYHITHPSCFRGNPLPMDENRQDDDNSEIFQPPATSAYYCEFNTYNNEKVVVKNGKYYASLGFASEISFYYNNMIYKVYSPRGLTPELEVNDLTFCRYGVESWCYCINAKPEEPEPSPTPSAPPDTCDELSVDRIKACGCIPAGIADLTSKMYFILQIIGPVLLLILGGFEMAKAISTQDESAIEKAKKKLVNKFIAAAAIFFVFTIMQFLVSLLAKDADGIIECVDILLNGYVI